MVLYFAQLREKTYERKSIELQFRIALQASTELIPNYAVKSAIEKMPELLLALKFFRMRKLSYKVKAISASAISIVSIPRMF